MQGNKERNGMWRKKVNVCVERVELTFAILYTHKFAGESSNSIASAPVRSSLG